MVAALANPPRMIKSSLYTAVNVSASFSLVLAVAMLIPMVVDLSAGHPDWQAFLASALIVGTLCLLGIFATRGHVEPFSLRLGFMVVNLLWVMASVVGALPFMLSSLQLSPADAVFESVSGLTTTGATILVGLDSMSHGILLWRSLTHWIGGIGIIAIGLLLMPFLRVGGMQIFRMESSTKGDSPTPRFAEFTLILGMIYLGLTLACTAAYLLAGMNFFDAVNHAMATVSTGGFATKDSSFGSYGPGVLVVAIVFMTAGALPFIALVRAFVLRDIRRAYEPQIPVLLGIFVALSALVALGLIVGGGEAAGPAVLHATFNVVSIVTTTGFASADYNAWGPHAVGLFLFATILGGAAGSTSGGLKTYRIIVLVQALRKSLRELVYPNGVFVVRYAGAVVNDETIASVALFCAAFFGLWLVGSTTLSLIGLDLVTAVSGSLTALTNVGPGLGPTIGPAGNFATLPESAKWILSVLMVVGRLEILTVFVLFGRGFWRG